MSSTEPAIRCEQVGMRFRLPAGAPSSLKESIFTFLGGGNGAEDFWALRDITLEVEQGEAIGVLGGNGAGKTTLLCVLAGIYSPTTGVVRANGSLVPLIDLTAGFLGALPGRENVMLGASLLGMSKRQALDRMDAILDFSGLGRFVDVPVRTYSSGMLLRLGFSVAVHAEGDILILDDTLSVGDAAFQCKALDRIAQLRESGKTLILASHDTALLAKVCDRACVLSEGKMVFSGGVGECAQAHLDLLHGFGSRDAVLPPAVAPDSRRAQPDS